MKETITISIILWTLIIILSAAIIYVSVNYPVSELPEWFKFIFFSRV